MSNDDLLYLKSILLSIGKIAKHQSSASHEDTIRDAVIYNLANIGEASVKLSPALREQYSEIPWRKIIANRNILIHEYLGVDVNIVQDIIQLHLPELKEKIEAIIRVKEGL